MTQTNIYGQECKAYHSSTALDGSSNTAADVTRNEITGIRDVTVNLQSGTADFSSRGNGIRRSRRASIQDWEVTFQIVYDTSDTQFQALLDAYIAGNEVALLFFDGPEGTADNEGFAGNWAITSFTRNEPFETEVIVDVTVVLYDQGSNYVDATV